MLRTQEQRDKLCRSCPIARVADLIGDPCSLLILRDLQDGPRRFTHFDKSLGMSTRTLSKKLRRLVRAGFVTRRAFKRLSPRVEYRLTPKGRALEDVLDAMRAYGKRYYL
jgi:DNA-binding HxlR family transcriptional regulator